MRKRRVAWTVQFEATFSLCCIDAVQYKFPKASKSLQTSLIFGLEYSVLWTVYSVLSTGLYTLDYFASLMAGGLQRHVTRFTLSDVLFVAKVCHATTLMPHTQHTY